MSDDNFVSSSVEAKDVYGVAGDNRGTVNQYFVSRESEIIIQSRSLIKGSPYLGLEKFAPDDKDKFFGREQWIENLSHYFLAENHNVLLLLGASGSGKSSLIGAGLIPKLKDDWGAFKNLTFVPDEDPFLSLHSCLSSLYGQAKAEVARPDAQTDQSETLVRVVQSLKQDQQWLIFIDQFEELFTRTPRELCDGFVVALVKLIQTYEQDQTLKIVMTMRADFLDRLGPYEDLGKIHNQYGRLLTDMNDRDLELAIKEPAARNGVVFEPGLVDEIRGDFRKQAGLLPLLQYTLDQLWKSDDVTERVLNRQTYTALGGVTGALQKQADKIFSRLTEAQREAAKQILLDVVKLDQNEPVSRRTAKAQILADPTKAPVLEILIQNRLLVGRENEGQITVEVAHEALLRNWGVIQELIRENKEIILLRERLTTDARQWHGSQEADPEKARDELWGGSKLERVLELGKAGKLQRLESENPLVTEFIAASTEHSELRLVQEKKRNEDLQRALTKATLQEQSTRVLNWVTVKPLEAVVLAIQTMGLNLAQNPEPLSAVQTAVQQAMEKGRVPAQHFQGHTHGVLSVAFSPDGSRIVSGSYDKTMQLWDLQGNAIGQPFQGHTAQVNSVAFSPDGSRIVSGSWDKTMRLWDLQGNSIGQPFQGHEDRVNSVAFSPDGSRIVSGSRDKTMRLWDLQGNAIGQPFQGHTDGVNSVAFSPDGSRIVSGSYDKTIRLWDLQGNAIGQPFQGHESAVNSVAFAPDGSRIVSGSRDKTIRLWDLQGNAIEQPFQGYEDHVNSVAFSPDGSRIVSGSAAAIRLWDLRGNAIGQPFQGHESAVSSVAFAPDGQRIVSGSWDKTLHLWDLQDLQGNAIGQPFQGHTAEVNSVAFAPDGSRIVSGDKTLRLWDLQGNAIGQPFQGHTDEILSVAFSPDGSRIVSGSWDKTMRLWDLQGNPIGQPFQGHTAEVNSVAFSPDGSRIVSGSRDQTMRLWDLQGNSIGQPFQGHEDRVNSVAFSPDGSRIVSGSRDKTMRLWDLQGNPIGQPFQGHTAEVNSVAFSPDGSRIVSGSYDKTIRLWDLQSNAIGQPFQGHESTVSSVAFSPDGSRIVSGSYDKTIRLWDLQGNAIGQPFQGHEDRVWSVAFSPMVPGLSPAVGTR
jgi:WD40 repeat protein/energy-coupling factor transporter ATP-binding protein EcfA2